MAYHRSRESIKFSGSLIDPENAEDLLRTKTDIENSLSKILKLIKNENLSTGDGILKHSTKQTELVGLVEDLYKQHQSLYTQYDRVTEELEKAVSRRRNRKTPASSSDSDSEYFSSEEVEANRRRSASDSETPKRELDRGDATEFEEKLASLMKKVEILSQQKMDLELQVESQTQEIKQLSSKNSELNDQVSELELQLKEEKSVVYNFQAKLNNNNNKAKSNIAYFMAKMNELEQETKSLQRQKNEMEEKIKHDKNEASIQREELMEQLNQMQQKLNSLESENKELESEIESQREQMSQDLIQIENLKDNLAEMRSVEENMVEEKERFLEQIKELEQKLEAQNSHKNELEEQLRDTSYEIKQVADENKALQDRNHELRTAITQRGEEISNFMREQENHKNGASMKTMALKANLNTMRLELDTMHEQKNKLEQQHERSQKEYAESMAKMETLNAKLAAQVWDQEKTIEKLNEENKQAKVVYSKLRLMQSTAERKMNELAEAFRRKMEDNIRLLHQRIHVAEQLNNENKHSCRLTKMRYEEENKSLGRRIASYEEESRVPSGFDLGTLSLAVGKVEEHARRVSGMACEVEFVKDWVRERNCEVRELRVNVEEFRELLGKKEEQELLLRENVWNLEAQVSKEGGEKLNLRKEVSQLEKKVGKLEKIVKEKDEELVSLGEKKREAIRQLCFVVDFHRERCNYLKAVWSRKRA
ncbi:COP1-interactive protein 1 [Cajanus cajan]|uniref:COP1-interactive protein 1 n=1 Tax=Cajanus cajan TaxID=3821 RepID=UPI00098D7F36|nr:COP1-interactive protein 1 [Cajanus cajan]